MQNTRYVIVYQLNNVYFASMKYAIISQLIPYGIKKNEMEKYYT